MNISKKLRTTILISSFLVGVIIGGANVLAAKWVYLGSRTVTDRLDRDTILVTGLRGDFRAIKLKVRNVGVDFHRVVIHYRSGGDQEIAMRKRIPAGGETRAIDLRGGDRVISSVEFWYDARTITGRRGVVSLYGLR